MPAVIFSGSQVKALKDQLNLNDTASVLTGSDDPTSVAKDAPRSSIYLRDDSSSGQLYLKQDDGSTTDWVLSSGLPINVKAVTTTATLAETDYLVTAGSASAYTITLYPATAATVGKRLLIKKTSSDTNLITIDGDSSDTIDGSATFTPGLVFQNEFVELTCTAANTWLVTNKWLDEGYAAYESNTGQTFSGTAFRFNWEDSISDVHSLVTTGVGTWKYEARRTGTLLISCHLRTNDFSSGAGDLFIGELYVANSNTRDFYWDEQDGTNVSFALGLTATFHYNCTAGDDINLRFRTNGASVTTSSGAVEIWVDIRYVNL